MIIQLTTCIMLILRWNMIRIYLGLSMSCVEHLQQYKNGKHNSLTFSMSTMWHEPQNHYDDSYFCAFSLVRLNKRTDKFTKFSYPNFEICCTQPIAHSDDILIPVQSSIWLFKNDSWVFLTKITAKLILNVTYQGWEMNIFHSRLPKTALNSIFLAFCLTEKMTCIKELCQKLVKNILDYIMQNSTFTQEKFISNKFRKVTVRLPFLS